MSKKLSVISAIRLIKALEKASFKKVRQRGSHVFMQHNDGRSTVIPVHKGEDLGPGLIRKILRDAEINRKDFIKLLKNR